MGWCSVAFQTSVLVGFVAVFLVLPMFSEYREQLNTLLSTCPMRWFDGSRFDEHAIGQETDSVVDPHSNYVIRTKPNDRLFTVDQLEKFDGREGSNGIFVAVLGSVYDVSAGRKHYGPDGSYSFFAAKDASRAFVTGDFTPSGLTDDVTGLTSTQWLDLLHWFQFYEKSYRYIGKLVGRFYDDNGMATESLRAAQSSVDKALDDKLKSEDQRKIFPPCNSRWSEASGSVVWCSDRSGGVARSWEGVPRMLFDATSQQTSCVCVRTTGPPSDSSLPDSGNGDLSHPGLRGYSNCPPQSNTCAS